MHVDQIQFLTTKIHVFTIFIRLPMVVYIWNYIFIIQMMHCFPHCRSQILLSILNELFVVGYCFYKNWIICLNFERYKVVITVSTIYYLYRMNKKEIIKKTILMDNLNSNNSLKSLNSADSILWYWWKQ